MSELQTQQTLIYEKVRHCRLEDKLLLYAKNCEIQEVRYRETLQAEAKIAQYASQVHELMGPARRRAKAISSRGNPQPHRPTKPNPPAEESKILTSSVDVIRDKLALSPYVYARCRKN